MKPVKELKIERDNLEENPVIPFEMFGIRPTYEKIGYEQVKVFKNSIQNAILLLTKHPNWEGKIKLNEWANVVYINGEQIEDYTVLDIIYQIAGLYGVDFSKSTILDATCYVAKQNPYNPFREYIEGIKLTPEQRQNPVLDRWLVDCFGVEDKEIFRVYGRKWAIGNIARSLFSTLQNPIQHDLALLFYGPQGAGKSTALRTLAIKTEWFSDIPIDMTKTREAAIKLQGVFIYELKELAKRAGIEAEKAFIDTRIDKYRPMYGKTDVRHVRRTNIAASTNFDTIFRDSSGSRRWLAVAVGKINTAELSKIVDQLWAEALEAYLEGIKNKTPCLWWLTEQEDELRKEEAERFTTVHPWKHKIKTWIQGGHISIEGVNYPVSPTKIMERLELPSNMQNKKTLNQIGYILNELGWFKRRVWVEDGTRPTRWIET